jgi:hypothetical protein
VKQILLIVILFFSYGKSFGQNGYSLLFPDSSGWRNIPENQELKFRVSTSGPQPVYFRIEGTENTGIQFDSLGNFSWKPSFDFVDRVSRKKQVSVIFEASGGKEKRVRQPVTFTVVHVNRPPVVEDLPVFYVRQSTNNVYQVPSEFVYDPDGDPLVFKSLQSQMPEGGVLSSQGQFSWNPSRGIFSSLKVSPLFVEFIVQDQPEKAETKGKLKIAQTQQDLPPDILIVPGDSLFVIKEDETLNLKIYISDPNGDENVIDAGFLARDKRIPIASLKSNTALQYEFTWSPGYDFVDDAQQSLTTDVTFYVLDKSGNRSQKRIRVKINDTENQIKKDEHLFKKYKSNLIEATMLIQQLDKNQRELNDDYKKAKKGKKKRSILNASLGAVTGLSPLVIQSSDESKIVSGIGGTTVLTLGTLEATEVIGRSKEGIMDKIKTNIDLRNRTQAAGDEFARKYALKLPRRSTEFDKDIEKLRAVLNDQRIVLLELDAHLQNASRIEDKTIKKVFLDYSDETK